MVITSDFIDIATSKERTEQAIEGLEKLKSIISSIESHYNILQSDYITILDDAINKVNELKLELDKLDKGAGNETAVLYKRYSPEVPVADPSPVTDCAEIVMQPFIKETARQENVKGWQLVVDAVGDAIEVGLDKIGNGLMFPIQGMVKLIETMRK